MVFKPVLARASCICY